MKTLLVVLVLVAGCARPEPRDVEPPNTSARGDIEALRELHGGIRADLHRAREALK